MTDCQEEANDLLSGIIHDQSQILHKLQANQQQLLNHSASESSINSSDYIVPAQLNIYAILGLEEPEMHIKSKEAVRKLRPLIKKGNNVLDSDTAAADQPVHQIRNSNIHNIDLPSLISEESNEDESSSSNDKKEDPLTQSITALNEEL